MSSVTTSKTPSLVALDWGTSSFRGWLLDSDGKVLETIQTELGILKIKDSGFEAVFDEQLGPLV